MWWRKRTAGSRLALDGTKVRFEQATMWLVRSPGAPLGIAPDADGAEQLAQQIVDKIDGELFSAAWKFIKSHPDKSPEQLLAIAHAHNIHPNAVREVLERGKP